MIRTIQCPLPPDPSLIGTIKVYNEAVQHVLDAGWEMKEYNKNKLHFATYDKIREDHPELQSSLVQCARDVASASLKFAKKKKWKCNKPVKKPMSSVRYNQRTFTPFLDSKQISISTIDGRKRYELVIPTYFQQYMHGKVTSLTLRYKPWLGKVIAYITIEIDDVPVNGVRTFVGVDRGIKRVAVLSNNQFYDTNHVLATKWKYQQLRTSLQSKGTRSAKRKLKQLSGRERRFMTDENRTIAKWICDQPFDCVVLENLKGIKTNAKKEKKVSKKTRRKFGNWAYYQLERFVIERAEKVGKTVLFVPPKYTSQRCNRCGHVSKKNRKTQSEFRCVECGFELNADLNASRNLSDLGNAVFGRASVNSPNVAVTPNDLSIDTIGRPSYKPTTLVVGS